MKLLIEEFIPVEEISEEARIEKLGNAKPPIFSLHYWWARKPLITARAAVLGALISKENLPKTFGNGDLKTSLLHILRIPKDIKKGPRAHTQDPPAEFLKDAIIKTWGEIPTVLDPFAGGGSIPFEALRLGCNVVAVDYNPVAYLILKATLEYPKKYGMKLYYDVKKYAEQIFNELKEELGRFYPKHDGKDVAAYIFAWVVKCPQCGFETPLVGSWQLAKTKKRELYLAYKVEGDELKLEIKEGKAPEGNVSRGNGVCLKCGAQIPNEEIVRQIRENEKERMLAVVLLSGGRGGKEYDIPSDEDLKAFEEAEKELKKSWFKFYREGLIPDEEMPRDYRFTLYLPKHYHLFNPRQLLLMVKFAEKARRIVGKIAKKYEDYAKAVGIFLSIVLVKHAYHNCRSVGWNYHNQQVRDIFAFRRPSISWNYVDVNPFAAFSGTINGMIDDVLDSLKYSINKLSNNCGNLKIHNESTVSWSPHEKFKVIITDPPYYDDIPYGELSEVFYIWHRRIVGHLLEKESKYFRNDKVETAEELDVGGNRNKEFFNTLFIRTMQNVHNLLDDKGILVLFFAHKNPEAWYFVLEALRRSGFNITATFPIHTEFSESQISMGKKSIYHSLIITARKRKEEKTGIIEEILPEIEQKIYERADELEKYGLKGSDLLVAAMGVALEVLTSYSEIKSYSGKITAKNAIEIAQTVMARYITRKMIGEDADAITTFYVYSRLNGMDTMDYDTANQFIKSLGLNEEDLEKSGLIKIEKKKGKKSVILQDYYRGDSNIEVAGYDTIKGNSLIDYIHKALRAYDIEGMKGFDKVMSEIPYSRKAVVGVLQALARIRLDASRQNDREANRATEILEHLKRLDAKLERWGVK
jgi:adenine-specific DNA methylase